MTKNVTYKLRQIQSMQKASDTCNTFLYRGIVNWLKDEKNICLGKENDTSYCSYNKQLKQYYTKMWTHGCINLRIKTTLILYYICISYREKKK